MRCPLCMKSYLTDDILEEHIATQHLDYIQWKCALCGLKKYKQEQVEEHQRTVHKRKTGVIIYTFDDTKKFGLQTLMKAAACRDRNDEITHVVENGRDAEISPVVRAFSSPIIEQTPSTEAGPSTSGQMNAKVKTETPEPEDNNSSANFEQQGSSNENYEGDLFRPVEATVKMESEEVGPSSSKQTTSKHAPKRDVVSTSTTQVARTHVQPKYSQLGKQQNLKVFQPAAAPELKDDRVKCMKCSYHVGVRHMKLHVMNHLFMEENICCFSCGFPGCIYKAYSKNIVTAHINKFHGNRGDYPVIESITPHIEQKIQALFKECFDNAEKIVLREDKLTGKNLNAIRSEDGRIYCKKCDQPISSANLKIHAFSHLCENEPDIECFKCSFPGCDYKHFVKQPVSAHIQRYHSENYQVQGTTSPELDRKIEKTLKECFDIVINSEGEASSSNSATEPPTKKIKTEDPQPENGEKETPEATGNSEKTIECRVCYKSISNSGPEDYSIIRHLGVHMHKIYNMPRYSCQICSYQSADRSNIRTHCTNIHLTPEGFTDNIHKWSESLIEDVANFIFGDSKLVISKMPKKWREISEAIDPDPTSNPESRINNILKDASSIFEKKDALDAIKTEPPEPEEENEGSISTTGESHSPSPTPSSSAENSSSGTKRKRGPSFIREEILDQARKNDQRLVCKLCGYSMGMRHLRLHAMNHLYKDDSTAPYYCTKPKCQYRHHCMSAVIKHIKAKHGKESNISVGDNLNEEMLAKISAKIEECFAPEPEDVKPDVNSEPLVVQPKPAILKIVKKVKNVPNY